MCFVFAYMFGTKKELIILRKKKTSSLPHCFDSEVIFFSDILCKNTTAVIAKCQRKNEDLTACHIILNILGFCYLSG